MYHSLFTHSPIEGRLDCYVLIFKCLNVLKFKWLNRVKFKVIQHFLHSTKSWLCSQSYKFSVLLLSLLFHGGLCLGRLYASTVYFWAALQLSSWKSPLLLFCAFWISKFPGSWVNLSSYWNTSTKTSTHKKVSVMYFESLHTGNIFFFVVLTFEW